ncbi:MAG: hypothetical protein ABI818_00455 [Acidobacteriota bacterium]
MDAPELDQETPIDDYAAVDGLATPRRNAVTIAKGAVHPSRLVMLVSPTSKEWIGLRWASIKGAVAPLPASIVMEHWSIDEHSTFAGERAFKFDGDWCGALRRRLHRAGG